MLVTVRDCLILGAGRSGTSLVAGLVRDSGYYMGSKLIPANAANPRGFFESRRINGINEELLASNERPSLRSASARLLKTRFNWGHRWIFEAAVPLTFKPSSRQLRIMKGELAHRPYCFKDPRFSFTLPAWRPLLGDTALVCVFRNPVHAISSILKQCNEAAYLRRLHLTVNDIEHSWRSTYEHILAHSSFSGDWLFLSYDDTLRGITLPALGRFLEADIDNDFPDPSLDRGSDAIYITPETAAIYNRLKALSKASVTEG